MTVLPRSSNWDSSTLGIACLFEDAVLANLKYLNLEEMFIFGSFYNTWLIKSRDKLYYSCIVHEIYFFSLGMIKCSPIMGVLL